MHFSSDINRPPYEADDAFLQITSGCSHGQCRFCTFYKDARFHVSSMDEIEDDIRELIPYIGHFNRIYLQGADPFIVGYEKLMNVAELIHRYLPSVKSIGGYARVDNIRNKSVEQLRNLKQAGYSNFYFGNESGDDVLLERMNKGYHAQVVVEQLSKLDEAGMEYIVNFLGGLGGHGYGLRHAQESARIINQLHPTMIYASELTLFPDTPLMQDVKGGKFVEAGEMERMIELKEFLNCITIPTVFKAEHVTIPVPIRGHLPEDKPRMLETIDQICLMVERGELDDFRSRVKGL